MGRTHALSMQIGRLALLINKVAMDAAFINPVELSLVRV